MRLVLDKLQAYKVEFDSAPYQPRGLNNKSNWCYVNSALQVLLAALQSPTEASHDGAQRGWGKNSNAYHRHHVSHLQLVSPHVEPKFDNILTGADLTPT